MGRSFPAFSPSSGASVESRFDEFIAWAQPGGKGGFNAVHADGYNANASCFTYLAKYVPHGHRVANSWFLRREYLGRSREVVGRNFKGGPKVVNSNGLVAPGRFLAFAKAYLNIMVHYRDLRSQPKPLISALLFVEYALRNQNKGDNDPSLINRLTFEYAIREVESSESAQGVKYDIGTELAILAGMLQGGYQSKSFRFGEMGFRLLDNKFAFTSRIPQSPRLRKSRLNSSGMNEMQEGRLSGEAVASLGIAYRRCLGEYGRKHHLTVMAAIGGLAVTTVSMRISELVLLKQDALYLEKPARGEDGRHRLRIFRPKTQEHQDLPIPRKLEHVAQELFALVAEYAEEARQAFAFYIKTFGVEFDAIDQLYVPPRLSHYFRKEWLSPKDVKEVLEGASDSCDEAFPSWVTSELETFRFVREPGDVSNLTGPNVGLTAPLRRIEEVEAAAVAQGLRTDFPADCDRRQFIGKTACRRFVAAAFETRQPFLDGLFEGGDRASRWVHSQDLYQRLLRDFKAQRFANWPFVAKDHTTRLDEALLLWFASGRDCSAGDAAFRSERWWCPTPISASAINGYLNRGFDGMPRLFAALKMRLKNGQFPRIAVHATRKYHHTEALLAGVNEVFIDQLAGRRSGRQSDHYDMRTAHERLAQSMEGYDPEEELIVHGPVADAAPKDSPLVDRLVFLYEHAAPKHVTEVGACRTDWSLNPCEQYGDCMRCDQALWRKGDRIRLPLIKELRDYAQKMVAIGERKLEAAVSAKPLQRQILQFKETLARCEQILEVELDDAVQEGAIVTFAAPDSAMSASALAERLRTSERGDS